jgi:hypothetical protein
LHSIFTALIPDRLPPSPRLRRGKSLSGMAKTRGVANNFVIPDERTERFEGEWGQRGTIS